MSKNRSLKSANVKINIFIYYVIYENLNSLFADKALK